MILSSILSSKIRSKFHDFVESSFTPQPLRTFYSNSKDFSFVEPNLSLILDNFVKILEKKSKFLGFIHIKKYFEGLSTSRIPEKSSLGFSEGIIEKTESISRRINGIIGKITERGRANKEIKEKEDKMMIPKLKISRIVMKDPKKKKEFIIENRCKELLEDMNEISQAEVKRKVLKGWKSFLFRRNEKKMKIMTLAQIRFIRFAKGFFSQVNLWLRDKRLNKAKRSIAISYLEINRLRRVMGSLHSYYLKQTQKKNTIKSFNVKAQFLMFKSWLSFVKLSQTKSLKTCLSLTHYKNKLLSKLFKTFKVRAKEIQIQKNQNELVRVFYEDKIILLCFKFLRQGCLIIKQQNERNLKAQLLYFRKLSKNFIRSLKAGCLLSIKHRHIKALSILHFSSKNKQKFIENLKSLINSRQKLDSISSKADKFRFTHLTLSPLRNWFDLTKQSHENRLSKRKGFLIYCNKLILKVLYGWKKQYPKERYKRLRTIRLQNKIEWNIVDSLFCDWLQKTIKRVRFSQEVQKNFRLKVIKKHFSALKTFSNARKSKYDKWQIKVNQMDKKKLMLGWNGMKEFYSVRAGKNIRKKTAENWYINRIFRKWNKLGKIKAYLKYLTRYHYAKYLFARWKGYIWQAAKMSYAEEHREIRVKFQVFKVFKSILTKSRDLECRLDSYAYYKNLKIAGECLDKWINLSSLNQVIE